MGCQPRFEPGSMKSSGLHVGIANQRLVQRFGRRQALDVQFTEGAIET